jgi:hypothetical protein
VNDVTLVTSRAGVAENDRDELLPRPLGNADKREGRHMLSSVSTRLIQIKRIAAVLPEMPAVHTAHKIVGRD